MNEKARELGLGGIRFTRLQDATEADFAVLVPFAEKAHAQVVDNVLAHLQLLKGDRLGFLVDRFDHSLQTATRAERDGADEQMIVCALLHDIGDLLAPDHHGDFAAAVLKPYVSDFHYNVVKYHPEFQGYFYWDKLGRNHLTRDRHKGQPWFDAAHVFCERWDQVAFDPEYDSLPLEHFLPMVRRVFSGESVQTASFKKKTA